MFRVFGVAQLVLRSVKPIKSNSLTEVAAFEAVESGCRFLQHGLLHVDPRRKDALALDVIDAVHQRIKRIFLYRGAIYADLVRIRKAERKAHVHLLFIFSRPNVSFAADVAPRLLHLRQDPVQFRAQFHQDLPIVASVKFSALFPLRRAARTPKTVRKSPVSGPFRTPWDYYRHISPALTRIPNEFARPPHSRAALIL